MKELEQLIRDVTDFPKKGIVFKDISPLLEKKFPETIDALAKIIQNQDFDSFAGIESRGFIFAAALAQKMNKGFIPIRKKGKLPPPITSESYQLEYGEDTLEISTLYDQQKIVIVDDVIATGGTLRASLNLARKANLEVASVLSLINLKFLNNLDEIKAPIHSLFEY